MKCIFGVDCETNALVVIGRASYDTNGIKLDFGTSLVRIGRDLRRWIFVGPNALSTPPEILPETIAGPSETSVWANLLGKHQAHRPLIWIGWPLIRGGEGLALLRAVVQCPGLEAYEPKQDGFVHRLAGEPDGQSAKDVRMRGTGSADSEQHPVSAVRQGLRDHREQQDGDARSAPAPRVKKRRARSLDSA